MILKSNASREVMGGGLFATFMCVIFVLIFALVLKVFALSGDAIPIVTKVIKGACVVMAVFKSVKEKHLCFFKGFLIAVAFVLISSLVFFIFGGGMSLSNILSDILIFGTVGIVSGCMKSAMSR